MDTVMTDRQLVKLVETMRQKEMTPARLSQILSSGILADVMDPTADLTTRPQVQKALGIVGDPRIITVLYQQSLGEMMIRCNFDEIHPDITAERCPFAFGGVTQFEAVCPKFGQSSYLGRPWFEGRIEHLLAFAGIYPEEQVVGPILCLGSEIELEGGRYWPTLSINSAGGRSLVLTHVDNRLAMIYRRLVVRRPKGT